MLRIGKDEYMIQFLLDGGDTTWVLAFDHIYDLLWKRKFLFLSNISVFDDIDGDVVIDKSDDVQIQIFNRALYFNDVLFPILLLRAFLMIATVQSSLSSPRSR